MMIPPMRALSIRQPWCEAVLRGWKTIENRTWNTQIRTRILLHAASKTEPAVHKQLTDAGYELTPLPQLPRQAFVGTVEIVATHQATECDQQECAQWGFPDVWHWQLADPHGLALPVPGHGRLGLFIPDVELGDAL